MSFGGLPTKCSEDDAAKKIRGEFSGRCSPHKEKRRS
jgi:hypothetical protein